MNEESKKYNVSGSEDGGGNNRASRRWNPHLQKGMQAG